MKLGDLAVLMDPKKSLIHYLKLIAHYSLAVMSELDLCCYIFALIIWTDIHPFKFFFAKKILLGVFLSLYKRLLKALKDNVILWLENISLYCTDMVW